MSLDPPFVHNTATVEDGAVIGAQSMIWHFAHVRSGATIGSGTTVGKGAYIDTGVTIGSRCKIQNNVSVYRGVSVSDDVFIGPGVCFTNDRHPRAFGAWQPVTTAVRTGASIGANATIVCGVVLFEYCMIAAGAVVTRDVQRHELVAGNPALHLGWVCRCGQRIANIANGLHCDTCLDTPGQP
jgi:acetyltransferase-like isoleucine patch superfamily enzyme